MAAAWIRISLVVSHPRGDVVTATQLAALDAESDGLALGVVSDRPKWHSALVTLVDEEAATHAHAAEPSESFARAIDDGLERAARWIGPRAPKIRALAASGLDVRVIATAWIVQGQIDLDLPPAFLAACADAGLAFRLVTNE